MPFQSPSEFGRSPFHATPAFFNIISLFQLIIEGHFPMVFHIIYGNIFFLGVWEGCLQ